MWLVLGPALPAPEAQVVFPMADVQRARHREYAVDRPDTRLAGGLTSRPWDCWSRATASPDSHLVVRR